MLVLEQLEVIQMEDETPKDYSYHPWPEDALTLAVKDSSKEQSTNEIYDKIPEERRKELRGLAKVSVCEKEKQIREFVVDAWQFRQRERGKHESEK